MKKSIFGLSFILLTYILICLIAFSMEADLQGTYIKEIKPVEGDAIGYGVLNSKVVIGDAVGYGVMPGSVGFVNKPFKIQSPNDSINHLRLGHYYPKIQKITAHSTAESIEIMAQYTDSGVLQVYPYTDTIPPEDSIGDLALGAYKSRLESFNFKVNPTYSVPNNSNCIFVGYGVGAYLDSASYVILLGTSDRNSFMKGKLDCFFSADSIFLDKHPNLCDCLTNVVDDPYQFQWFKPSEAKRIQLGTLGCLYLHYLIK